MIEPEIIEVNECENKVLPLSLCDNSDIIKEYYKLPRHISTEMVLYYALNKDRFSMQ